MTSPGSENLLPFTPMMSRYREVKAQSFEKRLATATALIEDPSPLCDDFATSIAQWSAGYAEDHAFHGGTPTPQEPAAPEIGVDSDVAWYVRGQGALPVEGHDDLDWVDYELSITRKLGDARFDTPGQEKAGRYLLPDLLLANHADHTPAICEIKLRQDKDPYCGLIQLLTYAAHLSTASQYARLRKHYPAAAFPDNEPLFDAYVLLLDFEPGNSDLLLQLDHAAHDLAAVLVTQPEIKPHIRRLACLDGTLDLGLADQPLIASVRWSFET